MAGEPRESIGIGMTDLLKERAERLEREAKWWENEARRIDFAWTKTWQEFQLRYNERCAQVEKLEQLVVRLAKPKEQEYA